MTRAATVAVVLALALAASAATRDVAVRLRWNYKQLPSSMQVFSIAPGAKTVLWKTGTVGALSELPLGEETGEHPIAVTPGRPKRLLLVYANHGAKPLYFFAAPHHTEPEESSLGFKFKCLCVNQAYEVGPGRIWYRVVELRVDPDFAGDELAVAHTLIGIDEARMKAFSKHPDLE